MEKPTEITHPRPNRALGSSARREIVALPAPRARAYLNRAIAL